ncbi:ANTAR domain-containing protein [Ancylobacter sp. MQZ15Z-1]|uniref:ANTAR domain-containing protein n=1 Tax=Ancylobacter mangrovi TaxID=2972472 RepID=A0A9X2PEA0_9HYPH|nr:ANTAR domain-containing protein [Ancylobacter mangrovi]MCS0497142.1 ANTAR domain-containing protein [Ancylobacter mangrovi]
MSIRILHEFRGQRVGVIHPPGEPCTSLVGHLRGIGCTVETIWPVPEAWPEAEIVFLAMPPEAKAAILALLGAPAERRPMLVAVVGHEDAAALPLVLESNAAAVIEQPIEPVGLLANLAVARGLWLEREEARRTIARLERKLGGVQKIQRAKNILMAFQGISEEDAYQSIRRQAMAKRMPMEDMALTIIHASEHLNYRPKDA